MRVNPAGNEHLRLAQISLALSSTDIHMFGDLIEGPSNIPFQLENESCILRKFVHATVKLRPLIETRCFLLYGNRWRFSFERFVVGGKRIRPHVSARYVCKFTPDLQRDQAEQVKFGLDVDGF